MDQTKTGRPAVGPRATINLTDRQIQALATLGVNRAEWIRDAIDQRLSTIGCHVQFTYAQDQGTDYDTLTIIDPKIDPDEDNIIDTVNVTPSEERDPYDEALKAAGWIVIFSEPGHDDVVIAAAGADK